MDKKQGKTLVTYAICLLALSEIINLTIVSVAFPQLMGAFGANVVQVALTMTSYMVAAAIFMPLSGLVINKFGMRKVALISISIFTICTILCGTATSLDQMIIYRTIQGIGGAFFPPMAQSYIVSNFENEERSKKLNVLTTILFVGPIVAPVFGGYLTQNVNWSWIFYVNIPLMIFAFVTILLWMDETPLQQVKIDYLSFIFMAIGIGCLEFIIDEGNSYMWFQSYTITIVGGIAFLFLTYFFWRAKLGYCVINFAVFKDKNFSLCCTFLFLFYLVASSFMNYLPTILHTIWGYQIDIAGYLTIPRGVFTILMGPLIGRLIILMGNKTLMIVSCVVLSISIGIFSGINLSPSMLKLFLSQALIGFSLIGCTRVLFNFAYLTLPRELTNDASGVFNFFRTFSGSVGASITATIITINHQVSWHDLVSHLNPFQHSLKFLAPKVIDKLSGNSLLIVTSWAIDKQSYLLAYISIFVIFAWIALLLAVFPLLMDDKRY